MNSAFLHARAIALTLLNLQPHRTVEAVRAQAALAARTTRDAGMGDVDVDQLVAQLLHEANIEVPSATLMGDPTDHEVWLPYRRGKIVPRFWSRYEVYLAQEKRFPAPAIKSLNDLTDEVLGWIEDPERKPSWDSRGMVVGSVQSGKTANYCGLICKAIDAGYKLIVVLAGMHDNLRSQTQFRIDEGVLGRDSRKDRSLDQSDSRIGVGRLFGDALPIHTLTTSLDKGGDFRAPKAETGVGLGGDPVVLVIKKWGSVLKNVLKWALHVRGEERADGEGKIIRGVPLLVIDDEADNASINTKDTQEGDGSAGGVTVINGRIRELLAAFEKSAYVGYTATPFANIFINPEAETDQHGEDLFPRSFVLNVEPPSNYVSPSRVFGLDGDPDAGIEPQRALPLFRPIDDYEDIFPPRHRKDLSVEALPPSLIHALHCFVLVCAVRRARGQTDVHNSMLVHVTRFIDVQHEVAARVKDEIDIIRRRLKMGDGGRADTLLDVLQRIWTEDFQPTSAQVREQAPTENLREVTWESVAAELPEAASRIEVKEINGHATDALDYVAYKQGLSVVAVGGNKLSRGLTLEGLSISYFLRTTKMYDTLMQMGRWFGYRPGYLDLCRLFTTEELRRWYQHVALSEVELRREFNRMKVGGLTPRQYGLRVREHPGGLIITALNKMAHGRTQRLSYAGQLVQTAHFSTRLEVLHDNQTAVRNFLEELGGAAAAKSLKGARLWEGVKASQVVDRLLSAYRAPAEGVRFQKPELMEFIRRQATAMPAELTTWTVALVDTDGEGAKWGWGDLEVGSALRSPEVEWKGSAAPPLFAPRNANIQSPSHQALDLEQLPLDAATLAGLLGKRTITDGQPIFSESEAKLLDSLWGRATLRDAAVQLTRLRNPPKEGTAPGGHRIHGEVARQLRPTKHGLLLIYPILPKLPADAPAWSETEPFMGLAFSFPSSHTARAVDYKVNKVWQAILRDEDYPDED